MSNVLYLGSQSSARHILLRQAAIPFQVIPLSVNEEDAVVSGSVEEQVCALADYKHAGICIEQTVSKYNVSQHQRLFFLTADTLIAGKKNNTIYGKPRDRVDAARMVREISAQEITIVTGMSLSVYRYDRHTSQWKPLLHDTWHAGADARFSVDDAMIEQYLDACPAAMYACGATVIEEIGIRYFSSIHGSYTGALGIDLFSLNQRLKEHHFWS